MSTATAAASPKMWIQKWSGAATNGPLPSPNVGGSMPAKRTPRPRLTPEQIARLNDADWLEEQYIGEIRDANAIAAELGCSGATVLRHLKLHGIQVRTRKAAARIRWHGNEFSPDECGRLYEAGFSTKDLSRRFRASPNTILATLKAQGVKTRSKKEAATLRRDTGRRKYIPVSAMPTSGECPFCGRTDKLEVHHRNGDRADNRSDNLILLCWEHHLMVERFIRDAMKGARLVELERRALAA